MKIFLFILMILISAGLVAALDILFVDKNKTKSGICKTTFKDLFLITLLTLSSLVIVLNFNNILIPDAHNYGYPFVYLGVALLIGLIYLGIKLVINKFLLKQHNSLLKRPLAITSLVFGVLFFALGIFLISVTIWGKNTYYNATIDQIIITIFSPTDGTDPAIMFGFFEQSLLTTITFTYLFGLIFYMFLTTIFLKKPIQDAFINKLNKALTWTTLMSGVVTFAIGFAYGYIQYDIGSLIAAYTQPDNFIENNYKDPRQIQLSFPKQKRNIIHFYLESVENSYFDKAHGGNMDENLMPNLLELSKDGYSFSHRGPNDGCGGPLTTNGATWSVASMVNQFFGVPMLVTDPQNQYGLDGKFFPGAVGMGDILAKAGYEQTMMIGARASFGGLDAMFKTHANFKIMDYYYARNNHMLPDWNYWVNWGYEDEKLYQFAKDELLRLNATGKPFHFLMENADTHFPGFAFDEEGNPIFEKNNKPKDYGKTIQFSEKAVAEFVRWIMKQDFYKNTTIIIIGDHLSMDKTFFEKHNFKGYERTTFNLILNPDPSLDLANIDNFYNRKWASFDMFPTILAAAGVKIDGQRLGLGTNLFSNYKTVYESNTYPFVNESFRKKSEFYSEHLLKGEINYDGSQITTY